MRGRKHEASRRRCSTVAFLLLGADTTSAAAVDAVVHAVAKLDYCKAESSGFIGAKRRRSDVMEQQQDGGYPCGRTP
jgi:hypothetical protein